MEARALGVRLMAQHSLPCDPGSTVPLLQQELLFGLFLTPPLYPSLSLLPALGPQWLTATAAAHQTCTLS